MPKKPKAKATSRAKAAAPDKPTGLLTDQQEAFAQHLVLHADATAAYRHAYDCRNAKDATVRAKASLLSRNPKIVARLQELQQRKVEVANERFDLSATSIIDELAAIAFSNAEDFLEWGERNVTQYTKAGESYTIRQLYVKPRPMDAITRAKKRAIAGVEQIVSQSGAVSVTLKLHDKRGALNDLMRHLGLSKDKAAKVDHKHEHRHELISNASATFDSRMASLIANLAEDETPPKPH